MRSILMLAIVAVLTGCAPLRHREATALHFDGVYQSKRTENHWSYLRFYPDGTVITVDSTGQPSDLRSWFAKDLEGVSANKVVVNGNRVSFSSVMPEGPVDHEGVIDGDRLRLHSYGRLYDKRHTNEYGFVKW